MMKYILTSVLTLFVSAMSFAQDNTTIYSWESPEGTVQEAGGTIEQHNSLAVSRINYESSGYYTIQLCGKKEYLTAEDNSLNAVYFTITLADGSAFKAGDKLEITAMRNNDDGGKSNIYFLFSNGVVVEDTCTWANLGKMHEVIFSGGTSAKGVRKDASTEGLTEYSLTPSTNSFVVPEEADGSTTLTLTRNESECKLYITKIVVASNASTSIKQLTTTFPLQGTEGEWLPYNLSGQRVNSNAKGIVIINGKKIVKQQ